MRKCSGCDIELPKRRSPSGRLFQPRVCSEACAKLVASRSGRKGGKLAAPKCPIVVGSRLYGKSTEGAKT